MLCRMKSYAMISNIVCSRLKWKSSRWLNLVDHSSFIHSGVLHAGEHFNFILNQREYFIRTEFRYIVLDMNSLSLWNKNGAWNIKLKFFGWIVFPVFRKNSLYLSFSLVFHRYYCRWRWLSLIRPTSRQLPLINSY